MGERKEHIRLPGVYTGGSMNWLPTLLAST